MIPADPFRAEHHPDAAHQQQGGGEPHTPRAVGEPAAGDDARHERGGKARDPVREQPEQADRLMTDEERDADRRGQHCEASAPDRSSARG